MKAFLAALALALLASPIAPALAQEAAVVPLDRIVAVVDDEVVLANELDSRVQQVLIQYADNPQQLPPRDILERQILERLIMQKIQVMRAEGTGIKIADAEVDQAMANIAQQNRLDISELRGAVQSQGMGYDQFRQNVREQLMMQRLRQRVAQTRVQVSDAEVDSLLQNAQFGGGQLHLGYILIALPEGASPEQVDEARARAEEAHQAIQGGMDFAAAALRWSNAESAMQGGDLGWRSRNEVPPALVDAADRLPEGGVSEPLRGPNGFHMIKLLGKRDGDAGQLVTEYKARHILVKVDELTGSDEAEQDIEAIRQRILAGEDFAAAAERSSQDEQTARLGGDMGWFTADAYGPGIGRVVTSLQPGGVSEPFQSQLGWHILQLDDTRTSDKAGEMQRDEARNALFARKAEDEFESFLRQARSESFVEIRLPGGTP